MVNFEALAATASAERFYKLCVTSGYYRAGSLYDFEMNSEKIVALKQMRGSAWITSVGNWLSALLVGSFFSHCLCLFGRGFLNAVSMVGDTLSPIPSSFH